MYQFNEQEVKQIESHGLTVETVQNQLKQFAAGFDFINLDRPASIGDGIMKFSTKDVEALAAFYDSQKDEVDVLKFVPASGAASRMFQAMFTYLEDNVVTEPVEQFEKGAKNFAFYNELVAKSDDSSTRSLIDTMLNDLEYGQLPKALIPFHTYEDGERTAVEEHLVEGCLYASSKDLVRIHFTVSPEHEEKISSLVDDKLLRLKTKYGIDFEISYSIQSPSTDTIAADENNEPFRTTDNKLFFRPGGHGALIKNLNDQDSDLIFVKNIDNVKPDSQKDDTVTYKKVIAGFLLQIKDQIHTYLNQMEAKEVDVAEVASFVKEGLGYALPADFDSLTEQKQEAYLTTLLDRPLRVSGMVINEGEPGGGPYWVRDKKGNTSLQIVEKSQINLDDKAQADILAKSSHFNPVDLVCWVRDRNGEKFDLTKYVDPETGFISEKSKDGKVLKAMELPGLWNGAMADWLTLFVEVPSTTFSPVKTVLDLLRSEHQS